MRFAFIQELEEANRRVPRLDRVPIRVACQVMGVSPSGCYAWKTRGRRRDAAGTRS